MTNKDVWSVRFAKSPWYTPLVVAGVDKALGETFQVTKPSMSNHEAEVVRSAMQSDDVAALKNALHIMSQKVSECGVALNAAAFKIQQMEYQMKIMVHYIF